MSNPILPDPANTTFDSSTNRPPSPHTSIPSSSPPPLSSTSPSAYSTSSISSPLHPSLYPGLLPPLPDNSPFPEKPPTSNAATAASAAGVRALSSQLVAFYFRAPVKAFFRTRVDYLAYARAIQEQEIAERRRLRREERERAKVEGKDGLGGAGKGEGKLRGGVGVGGKETNPWWRWVRSRLRATTPGVLASAVRHYGWRVVPDQVLPPLVANVGVGAVLYTSYLQVLARLHPESGLASKRVYPPPAPVETFAAGFLAGSIQSVVAAPLDAVQARWDVGSSAAGMTGSGNPALAGGNGNGGMERPKSMWAFSAAKLREIGVRGIFAGWSLSFLKDSCGSAVFFSVFEYLKAQGYYNFVTWYYGALNEEAIVLLSQKRPAPADGRQRTLRDEDDVPSMPTIIRPHYAIEPAFLLLAGMGASIAQQVVLHPLSHLQAEHWERLEGLDAQARKLKRYAQSSKPTEKSIWSAYRDAYRVTWAECVAEAQAAGLNMRQWLYRGFWWNTIRQVPSTSAGLIIFELVRRKYGLGGDQVRINRDGYDILLH